MAVLSNDFSKTIAHFRSYLVFALTLPWLPIFAVWLFLTIITFLLPSEPTVHLSEHLAGDYSGFFTYFGVWLSMSAIYIGSTIWNYVSYQQNRTHSVVSISILAFLFLCYFLVLQPEITLYLKIKNV